MSKDAQEVGAQCRKGLTQIFNKMTLNQSRFSRI